MMPTFKIVSNNVLEKKIKIISWLEKQKKNKKNIKNKFIEFFVVVVDFYY